MECQASHLTPPHKPHPYLSQSLYGAAPAISLATQNPESYIKQIISKFPAIQKQRFKTLYFKFLPLPLALLNH